MVFTDIPYDKLSEKNPDYEMELFWYGFKSLIRNYHEHFMDDDNILFIDKIDNLSKELNYLQLEHKYEQIYEKVYLFLKSFIKVLVSSYQKYKLYAHTYLFNWLKRYNKIKNAKKLETNLVYDRDKKLTELSEDEVILLKLKILESSLTKKGDLSLLQLFDDDVDSFLKECLEDGYAGIFDYISLRYNIDDFFMKNEWNIKGPIKGRKLISQYYSFDLV